MVNDFKMWDVINCLFLKLVENLNLTAIDKVYVKELLNQKNKLYLDVEWLEDEPLEIVLNFDEHPVSVLMWVFNKLSLNNTINAEDKIQLENLLINLKWFCEKLCWSQNNLLVEPMEVDI